MTDPNEEEKTPDTERPPEELPTAKAREFLDKANRAHLRGDHLGASMHFGSAMLALCDVVDEGPVLDLSPMATMMGGSLANVILTAGMAAKMHEMGASIVAREAPLCATCGEERRQHLRDGKAEGCPYVSAEEPSV